MYYWEDSRNGDYNYDPRLQLFMCDQELKKPIQQRFTLVSHSLVHVYYSVLGSHKIVGNEHDGETPDPFQNAALFYLFSYGIIVMEFCTCQ